MLRHRYGLSAGDVECLVAAQKDRCAICRVAGPRHVDHDHATGTIRGLLCFSCNGALGQFADCSELLRRAKHYLDQPRLFCVSAGILESTTTRFCFGCRERKLSTGFVVNSSGRRGSPFCRPCYDRREQDPAIEALVRRNYRLQRKYRIGLEQYQRLLELQNGLCASCRTNEAVDVDHDHQAGFIRGLLCPRCNTGIGQLKDDPTIITRAIDYLERWARPGDVHEPSAPYILSAA